MPEYVHPGVYVEELSRGPRPITGVPTSTAALLGAAERGPITPRSVTSYAEYVRWFGGVFDDRQFLPHAVNGFFEHGGRDAFICRIVGVGSSTAMAAFGDFTVRASGPGAWGLRVVAKISASTTLGPDGFRLQLAYWRQTPDLESDPFLDTTGSPTPDVVEDFDDLVTDETSPNFYGNRLPFIDLDVGEMHPGPATSVLAVLVRNAGIVPGTFPAMGNAQWLSGGSDDAHGLTADDFVGLSILGGRMEQGLTALERAPYRDVALVYAPNASTDVAKAIISHCEKLQFRFAVIDCAEGQATATALDPRSHIADSSHAAFYYPWLVTTDPISGVTKLVPPGGHVLGVYARSDTERGVFKSPANEVLLGVRALEFEIDDEIQDGLNSKGVNVIRSFPGRGIVVWSARTMGSNPEWKYINVRRLLIFLERSIYEGTQWVVFEPNDESLWARVKRDIGAFLHNQWRAGALAGHTAQDAYFVACDRTTMSQDDIDNGRLVCLIGVAVLRPAEFIILRIQHRTARVSL